MDFYDSMIRGFYDRLRTITEPREADAAVMRAELMKSTACQALEKIRRVLMDGRLDDPACFKRIEEIVRIFEELGSDGGGRHDF